MSAAARTSAAGHAPSPAPSPAPSSVIPAAEPLLHARDVAVRFHTPAGVVRAVDDVSLEVAPGETLALVGESGSGKTVLTRRLMGLVRGTGTTDVAGTVDFGGRRLTDLSTHELSDLWGREIALVLQDPMTSLNPVRRIGVQITETIRRHESVPRADAERRAVELLRSVGLSEPERRVREYPHELSGGMRQRVTIAIALACSPRLLLADEPTTALDVTVQAQILDLLAQLRRERGMALVLVTHDLRVVRSRADRIAVMYAGRLVETAPTVTLYGEPRMPYTKALMQAVPPLTGPNHVRLTAVPGRPPSLIDPPAGCGFAARCPLAQDRCLRETPPLVAASPDHHYRCWFPLGSPDGERAEARNVARGHTAAGTPVSDEMVL